MTNFNNNQFRTLLQRCFGDQSQAIFEEPREGIKGVTLDAFQAFIYNLNGSVITEATESNDEQDLIVLDSLRGTWEMVEQNLTYFQDNGLKDYAVRYMKDNKIDMSGDGESGLNDFVGLMITHKKDFLNPLLAVEDFLISDILHVFFNEVLDMYRIQKADEVFARLSPRTA